MNNVSNSDLSPPLGQPQSQKGVAFSEATGRPKACMTSTSCPFQLLNTLLPPAANQSSRVCLFCCNLLSAPQTFPLLEGLVPSIVDSYTGILDASFSLLKSPKF